MAKTVKPCGTPAAYQRHRRAGEEPCDACRAAQRENSRRYRQRKRDGSAAKVNDAVAEAAPVETVDALEEALDSLRIVRAVLHGGEVPANAVAGLTRRRDELVDRIGQLRGESGQKNEGGVFDELAKRRKNRGAAS
ncbi:hypothetical protein [Trueperella bialowiezensis]|uniref:Uncharacterized protein n=1 Tax=Trueperella bialowiezensis TaxID=312285 RepID=A0A448PE62_9ACTO|nr:hypothetical protein [Trueperella bialowiezensis]VEI13227.1 Uncharacterised protein [Trueperella bialowiezensis]